MHTFKNIGLTSDHIPQSIVINDGILKGHTWNMLERCYNKDQLTRLHSNNPLNLLETDDEYLSRKTEQIKVIIKSLCESSDFICLQEVDFLGKRYTKYCSDSELICYEYCETLFESTLFELEWNYVKYNKKSIAILYNTKKLQLIENTIKICFPANRSYITNQPTNFCMIMCDFRMISKFTQNNGESLSTFNERKKSYIQLRNITIGSFHLKYNINYDNRFEYIKRLYKKRLCIFAGDANHHPNYGCSELIVVDENIPTNFQTDQTPPLHSSLFFFSSSSSSSANIRSRNFTKVHLDDEREELQNYGRNFAKAFDGFVIMPPKCYGYQIDLSVSSPGHWEKIQNKDGTEDIFYTKMKHEKHMVIRN